MTKLNRTQVQARCAEVEDAFPHGSCLTCECFLGYVAQLRIDAEQDAREIFTRYTVDRKAIHPCLGCAPCPPGDLYAAYMREKRAATLLTL